MRVRIICLLGLLGAAFAAGPAAAEYSFCNKTSFAVKSALGFVDGERMATRGWWRLKPGECKVVLTDEINPGRYFVYAEAIAGHAGAVRTWSGDTKLCVEEDGFFTLRDQDACRDEARRRRSFFMVDVEPGSNRGWRTEFAEPANYTVYSAEIAGVQRMLRDLGYDISRIDGDLGPATIRAMNAFQRDKALEVKSTIDDPMVESLLAAVAERDRKLGLFYCNDARDPIWTAVAEVREQDVIRARGWWRIGQNECVKIIKGALSGDRYYVYGEMETRAGDRPLLGGETPLCVNPVMFERERHDACGENGFEAANFRRLDVGGAESWTFRFEEASFGAPTGPPAEPPPAPQTPPAAPAEGQ